jgi:pimeloyl-ACP methyl ester carboxylesterase
MLPSSPSIREEILPQIQTPVQIIFGGRDRVVPPVNAEYLHERLPHRELHLIDAGHFIWEDAADEYAAFVNAWWGGGFRTMPLDAIAGRTGQASSEAV